MYIRRDKLMHFTRIFSCGINADLDIQLPKKHSLSRQMKTLLNIWNALTYFISKCLASNNVNQQQWEGEFRVRPPPLNLIGRATVVEIKL